MKEKKHINYIRILALCLCIAGAIKVLFVGYDIDEQYALAMSYRMTQGDFLIYNMWEPHQTSGFLMALFMLPYLMIAGTTTGIALYVRICGLICHILVHFCLYKILKSYLHQDHSLLVCGISFFVLPKLMFLPEFANMQMWFLMMASICLLKYYGTQVLTSGRGKLVWLILAGFFTALEVLTYPSTVFVFGGTLFFMIFFRQKGTLIKELTAYILPCIFSAGIFMGILLAKIPLSDFGFLLKQATSDGSHSTTMADWIARHGISTLKSFGFLTIYAIAATILYYILRRFKIHSKVSLLWHKLWLLCTFAGQLVIWIWGGDYPNFPSVEYIIVPALVLIGISLRRIKCTPVFAFLVAVPFLAFPGVLLFSNHPLMASLPFLGPCVTGVLSLPEMKEIYLREEELKGFAKAFSYKAILFAWLLVIVFGKCYMVRTTLAMHYTVLDEVSLCRRGVAWGIVTDTIGAERNRDIDILVKEVLPENANVYYIGKYPDVYLLQDMEVCTPSTISTPTYDDNIYLYFELYPEKVPEYVIIESGFVYLPEGSWAAEFLEKHCEPEPMAENLYIKIYRCK